MAKTTLVKKDGNPKRVTTENPTVVNQLKAQGYRVEKEAAADSGKSGGSK